MSTRKPTVMIIDAHAIIHRAFHALPPLSTKDGLVVNAVYGFLNIVFKALKQLKPTHVAVAFDSKGPTFRHKQFPDYKGTRQKQPDELYQQIPIIKQFLEVLGFPQFELTGYEADDIIGTIARQLEPSVGAIYIVTGDMDTLQLVNAKTKVLAMRKGVSETVLYDVTAIAERYGGLTPAQVIDYKGLCGDSSDNIPGVAGIGEKTAIQLLQKYSTVENVLQHLDEQTGAIHKKLTIGQANATLSKQLATIDCQMPLAVTLDDVVVQPYARAALMKLLQQYEFKSLLKSVETLPHIAQEIAATATETTVLAEQDPATDRLARSTYALIDSDAAAQTLAATVAQQSFFAFDTETTSLETLSAQLVGMSICWSAGQAYYIPAKFAQHFFSVLRDPKVKKVGHNIKFDYKVLRATVDLTMQGIICDTMLASYVLNPGSRGHGLDLLAFHEFGYEMMSYEHLVGKGKDAQPITAVPLRTLAFYAAEDADYTWRLYEILLPRLEKSKLIPILDLEVELIPALADIELTGICLDLPHLQRLHKKLAQDITRLEKKIYQAAGKEFNISSPKQLKVILFDELKIDTQGLAKTKTGISTAASELEKMRGLHPIIDMISDYREVTKLQSTYVEALPKLVHPRTKRLHTNYQQTIAATGRLSSTDPNLQNIPIRTELGQEIRKGFVADQGKVLLSLDYSQIELRIIAHLANDQAFIEGFKRGADIHTQTAAEIQGVTEAEVTPAMRRAAKSINFGILYGMGSYGLARDAKISMEKAKSYLGRYFALHPAIEQYIAQTKALAKQQGYVETLLGRRRYLPDINSGMAQVRAAAERAAINMPAQGTAADIIKLAMLKVFAATQAGKISAIPLLQVHDELVFEVEEKQLQHDAKIIKTLMEAAYALNVPLIVDAAYGQNWQELTNLEF